MSHIPVLLQTSIDSLALKSGDIFLDATLGGGGHSEEIAKRFGESIAIIGLDQDDANLKEAGERISKWTKNFRSFESNFRDLDKVLEMAGMKNVNKILFDLGISSLQLEGSGRGFSFQKDEPLLMNMGKTDFTVKDIVNTWSEEHIADVIRGYGEERYAGRIANAIVEERKIKPIKTTFELVAIIEKAVPGVYRHGRLHFATRTFQALRVAVNDELGALAEGLKKAFSRLAPGGRVAVVSFHSLEDRIVKQYFRSLIKNGQARGITKKPITPSVEEEKNNPRSRSAKLRVIEKI